MTIRLVELSTVSVTDVDEPPSAPEVPSVTVVGSSRLGVSWLAPVNTGPPINSYKVRYRQAGSDDGSSAAWVMVDPGPGTATIVIISGLTANTGYEVQVQASSAEGTGDWSSSGSATITKRPPMFRTAPDLSVAENTVMVGGLFASDPDGGSLVWSLTGGADRTLFTLTPGQDANVATLSFVEVPDYEDPADSDKGNVYEVEVTVTDSDDDTTSRTFTVSVTDVDEPPPAPKTPSVTAVGSSRLGVSWRAPVNTGPPINGYNVRYRQAGSDNGSSAAWVMVDPGPGTATSVIISGLTANTGYEVQVQASNDEGAGDWSSSGFATTKRPPVFTTVGSNLSVAENMTSVTLSASDPDGGSLTWSLTGGADRTSFTLTPGQDTNAATLSFVEVPDYENPTDSDKVNVYEVEVTVTDSDDDTTSRTFTVSVTDVDEPPPAPEALSVTAVGSSRLGVSWLAPVNTGPPINDYKVRYRQAGSDDGSSAAWVMVDPGPGTTTSVIISGLTANTGYEVQVQASNDEGTGDWSESTQATTSLMKPSSGNDPPIFITPSGLPAKENNQSVGVVSASDPDGDSLDWSLTGGADQASFVLGYAKGGSRLNFVKSPDFENPTDSDKDNVYEVEVTVTDTEGEAVSRTFRVSVTNRAEPPLAPKTPSVIAADSFSLRVSWDVPVHSGRPPITGYNVRYRQVRTSTWTTVDPGSATSVTISDLVTGILYEVQVRAVNNEGHGVWSKSGTITAGQPVFTTVGSNLSVSENTTDVILTAHDPDGGDLTWKVTGGADRTLFTLTPVQNTNVATLSFKDPPDFEHPVDSDGDNNYMVEVKITAVDGETVVRMFTVSVSDDDSESPGVPVLSVLARVLSLSVSWDDPSNAGPAVTNYQVQYKLATTDDWTTAGWTTTRSMTISGLTAKVDYKVRVRAMNDEGLSDWSATVEGIPSANQVPVFDSSTSAAVSVDENTARVVALSASDPDGGDLTWEVSGGADEALFTLIEDETDSTEAVLVFDIAPDYENPTDKDGNNVYVAAVTVTDDNGGSAAVTITVTVVDVAEPPVAPGSVSVRGGVRGVGRVVGGAGRVGYGWPAGGDGLRRAAQTEVCECMAW